MTGNPRLMFMRIEGGLKNRGILLYEYANENLEAIITGLDVNDKDTILTVCGSGDQSFAFLEKAKKVVSVDNYEVQLAYAKKRITFLKNKKYEQFLAVTKDVPEKDKIILEQRNSYFKEENRLTAIERNLLNLYIIKGNIFEIGKDGRRRFSKVYLSNVFGYFHRDIGNYCNLLKELANNLQEGGLIYISNYTGIIKKLKDKKLVHPDQLEIEKELTKKARRIEDKEVWMPIVYKKV